MPSIKTFDLLNGYPLATKILGSLLVSCAISDDDRYLPLSKLETDGFSEDDVKESLLALNAAGLLRIEDEHKLENLDGIQIQNPIIRVKLLEMEDSKDKEQASLFSKEAEGIGTKEFSLGHAVYKCVVEEGLAEGGEVGGYVLSISRFTVHEEFRYSGAETTFSAVREIKTAMPFTDLVSAWKFWEDFKSLRREGKDDLDSILVGDERYTLRLVDSEQKDLTTYDAQIWHKAPDEPERLINYVQVSTENQAYDFWEQQLDDLFPSERLSIDNRFTGLEIENEDKPLPDPGEDYAIGYSEPLPLEAWPPSEGYVGFDLEIEGRTYSIQAGHHQTADMVLAQWFDAKEKLQEKTLRITKDRPLTGDQLKTMVEAWIGEF